MEMTSDQGSPQLIEPLYRRRRRILAVVVILIVIIGLLVSISTQPQPQNSQEAQGGQQEQQGGNITGGLIRVGQIIISFIAVLSSIVELTGVNVRDLFSSRAAKANVEEFPFYIFQDFDKLLAYLFPNPQTPLLPDRDIKYLPRNSSEIDTALQNREMVLIRGRSKTGKTREACEMLRRWWYSGPTVLVARSHVGLYPPFKIPENLPLRNLVIFFDDIDRYLGEVSSLKRLDETLQFFQQICHNRGEVRVVATARQEDEFWDKLKFDSSQTPWNKFELVQLDPLSSDEALKVIAELSEASGIAIEPELARSIAEKNNGTFLNLALAFRSWLSQNVKTVTAEEIKTFEGSLKNTWRRRYVELAASHPNVKSVYAAVDFMQSHNISLRPELIAELSTEMGMGKGLLSFLGWMDRLQNRFDMSPMFNWYRDIKRRRKGWIVVLTLGVAATYLSLYTFLRFMPSDVQVKLFRALMDSLSFQILCLMPLGIILLPFVFSGIMNILRNLAFRRTSRALKFLLDTEVPMRGTELRPYENQFEGNGSTNNWQSLNYAGEIKDKGFSSRVSSRMMTRYLSLAEQLRLAGEFSPARKLAELAQKIAPDHPAPFFMLGKLETDEGEYKNALAYLKRSQDLYLRSSNAAHTQERQALIYLSLKEYDNAEQTAQKALKEMPGLLTARWVLGLAQINGERTLDGRKNCKIAASSSRVVPIEILKVIQILNVEHEEWFKEIEISFSDSITSPRRLRGGATSGVAIFLSVVFLSAAFLILVSKLQTLVESRESGLPLTNALLTVFPDAPALLLGRGFVYYDLELYDEALANVNQAILIDPHFSSAYNGRGLIYANGFHEYDKAIEAYTKSINLDPEYFNPYRNRCDVYKMQGEYEKAIADCMASVRINPQYIWGYDSLANVYFVLGDTEKAFASYSEAILNNPDSAETYSNRAYAYASLAEYESAIADYTAAISMDPKYIWAYDGRANVYLKLGEIEKAFASYTEAIVNNPDRADAYFRRAYAYANLAEYEEAIADYTEAIRLNPKYVYAYNNRGVAYANLTENTMAIEDYTEALKINPKYALAYNNRGIAYSRTGETEKAILDFTEAIRLEPERANQCGVNISCITAAINLDPNNAQAYDADTLNSVCWRGSLSGYASQVLDVCEQAVLMAPNNANIRDSRGLARALTGNIEGAISDFQYFVNNSIDSLAVEKRNQWILELKRGNNPFTPALLESLK